MTYKQMIIDDQKETIRRLQQECTEKTNAIITLGEHLKAKGQECEKLKKERDTLSVTRNKLLDDLWVAEESLKDYIEHFNKASDELDQLKQTLAEIKDIAKNGCYDDFGMPLDELSIILQKISEYEVEDD